ncbi:hypothetical protein Leryth_017530 [Lithospermum erythrorhizon]|nr:hypothetical protein Leryth_017530 [Lithospermum erythrorhizon]
MKYLQYLHQLRSAASKPRPQPPPFSTYTTTTDPAASNDLLNLIATASPMEPALNKIHHFLNAQLITSLIQKQPDPYLSFRFFIWTTNFARFRNRVSTNLIIDKLICSCTSDKQEIKKGDGNEKKQECEKSDEELFDLYWSVLDEVKEGNYDVGSGAFGVLIKAYGKVGKAEKAVEAFGRMKEFGCEANLFTYNAVLHVLVEKEVTLLALDVFNTMLKSNCKPDCSTFNVLINGLCKNGRMEETIKTFDEMSNRGIVPNRITYMVVLMGLCRAKRVDDAYRLFRTMRSSGCEPDSVIYDVLVDGFCKMGRIGQALELSESFGEAGYVMGLRGYSSLIHGLVKTNRTDEAFQFFWKIFKLGITPDVVLYTIMIHGLCRMRRLKDAVNLARDMTDRGLVPDTPCYNTLIKGFCDMGLLDQARSLWLEISKNGCLPSSRTYHILIHGMCKKGLVDEAQQIFNDMEKFGWSASVPTFNALIDGLCKAGKLEAARLILYKMEIGKNPSVFLRLSQGAYGVLDSNSLQMMVEKLCESGLVLKAYKILTQLADEVVPDIYTYNILINGFCKVGKVDFALKLYEELHLKGNSPDLVTYVTLIDGLFRVGREVDGIKFYELVSKSEFSHLPEAHKVVMKWHCRRGKTSFALSIWLKHQKSLVGGQDDETLRFVEKLVEMDDMVRALKLLLKRDIKLKNMDSGPYNIILIGLCQARRTNEAMELFLILKETSWYISPPSCVLLISYLLREQNIDHAVDVFLYTLEKGLHLMPRVCNNLIGSLLRWQERATDAFHLLKQMKYTGYDLNAYLHDGTRFLLYRQWSTRPIENDTPRWDDFSAKIHLPLPAVTN